MLRYSTNSGPGGFATDITDQQRQNFWKAYNKDASQSPLTDVPYQGESDPSNAGGVIIAVEGDTLRSIAARLYGSAEQWYRLAEVNDIEPDRPLHAGQAVVKPSSVTATSTELRFDTSKLIGSTAPNLPAPVGKDRCGVMSKIIGLVVAIVVTIYTCGNYAAGAAAGDMARQYSAAAFNGRLDYKDLFRFMGRDLLFGPLGSLYNAGKYLNERRMPGLKRGEYDFAATAAAYVGGAVGGAVGGNFNYVAGAMAGAAASYVTSYSVNRVQGKEVHFNLRKMGASMAAAGATAFVGQQIFGEFSSSQATFDKLNLGQTANNSFAGIQFSWSAVARHAATNFIGSGISYGFEKAFRVKDARWDGKEALINALVNAPFDVVKESYQVGRRLREEAMVKQAKAEADAKTQMDVGAKKGFYEQVRDAQDNSLLGQWRKKNVDALGNALGSSLAEANSGGASTNRSSSSGSTDSASDDPLGDFISAHEAEWNTKYGNVSVPSSNGIRKERDSKSLIENSYIVSSGINSDGNRFDVYNTDAVTIAVPPQPIIEKLPLPNIESGRGLYTPQESHGPLHIAGEIAWGAGKTLVLGLLEPSLQISDMLTIGYNLVTDSNLPMNSMLGRSAEQGAGTGDLLLETGKNVASMIPVVGVARSSFNGTQAYMNSDWEGVGGNLVGVAGAFGVAKQQGYGNIGIEISNAPPCVRLPVTCLL